ncbi:hypothetical protein L596_019026 [Steinernema carpocapsae]|uniref:Uncharacterized protein n=1 Tax=Steinernema carpocapsae TaxID=34508 RepID=A0A4U5N6W0_STECR|nr:hypothetical protein L596_019026 [Steinernema carpocapsae]
MTWRASHNHRQPRYTTRCSTDGGSDEVIGRSEDKTCDDNKRRRAAVAADDDGDVAQQGAVRKYSGNAAPPREREERRGHANELRVLQSDASADFAAWIMSLNGAATVGRRCKEDGQARVDRRGGCVDLLRRLVRTAATSTPNTRQRTVEHNEGSRTTKDGDTCTAEEKQTSFERLAMDSRQRQTEENVDEIVEMIFIGPQVMIDR